MFLIANELSHNDASVLSQWWAEGLLVMRLAYVGQSKEQWFNTSPILHNTFPGSHPSKVKSWRFTQIEQNYAVVSDKTIGQCVSKALLVSAVWSSWNQGHSCHVHCKDCTDANRTQNKIQSSNGSKWENSCFYACICVRFLYREVIIVILVLTK